MKITQVLEGFVEIEANSPQEAAEIANERYNIHGINEVEKGE